MLRLVVTLLAAVLFNCVMECKASQSCSGPIATDGQQTHWGHTSHSSDFRDHPVKKIKGIVQDVSDAPVDGVLVEIFEHRDGDPNGWTAEYAATHRRRAACVTTRTGMFSFNLPPGQYQIRASKAGWNSTIALVKIDIRKGKKKDINLLLHVGT